MSGVTGHQGALAARCQEAAAAEQPGWLASLRGRAAAELSEQGLPRPKQEPWRYTPLKRLSEAPFEPLSSPRPGAVTAEELATYRPGFAEGHALAFVDGRLEPELSEPGELPGGVRLLGLEAAITAFPELLEEHLGRVVDPGLHGFTAAGAALLADGAVLHVPAGLELERPVHLVFYSTGARDPAMLSVRVLVVVDDGARATVIESWAGAPGARDLVNATTELVLGEEAQLTLVKSQRESPGAYHLASLAARQARGSRLEVQTANLGGGLVRNEVVTSLDGEGAEVELLGVSVTSGEQHVENHTRIDHRVAGCSSREVYRSVLDDRSTGVFRGQVVVHPGAQQTDSAQQSRNLLLSPQADMNTRPELEIYADDVQCSHGATVGQLDPHQLFYLRSRGIDLRDARRLLIQAFARDLLNRIPVEPLREELKERFSERFA